MGGDRPLQAPTSDRRNEDSELSWSRGAAAEDRRDYGRDRDFNRGGDRDFNRGGDRDFNRGGDRDFNRGGDRDFNRGGDRDRKADDGGAWRRAEPKQETDR